MRDRAVSEVIGFVLVFTLIVLTVSMATVFGFSTLDDARSAEQLSNTERAFDVLAHNQEDMFVRGAPSRATELRLADATLSLAGESELTLTIDGDDYHATTTPLVHSVDDAEIVYEHGAVLRTDHDSGQLIRDPPGRVDEDKTIIHLVNTSAQTGTVSVAGSGSHLVRTVKGNTTVLYHDDVSNVDLEIETTEARATAWERYWEDDFDDGCDVTGGTLTCDELQTDDLLLLEHNVSVAFE